MFYRFNLFLLFTFLCWSCGPAARIRQVETKIYPLGTPGYTLEDSAVYHTLLPYKTELDSKMNKVLGISEQVMEKGQPEGLLGNFVADLVLEQVRDLYQPADGKALDFCFLNNGGLRAALPKGEISKRKIFELMPFENELIILTLDGSTTNRLIQFIAAKGGMPVSGLRFLIRNKTAVEALISGQSLDTLKTYKVVTSDYLANGGDNMGFLAGAIRKETCGLKLRDAIINYVEEKNKRNQTLRIALDNRIAYAK